MEELPLLAALGSIVLGVSLAASCGLRAFLPLFLVGMLARFTDLVDIGEAFDWLTSAPALLALFVGVICELAGDKIPAVNHLLDAIQTPVRTLAGMLVSASVMVDMPTWVIALLAIIIGGGTALAVHAAKSTARVGVSAASATTANPLASALEDVACAAATLLSVVLWVAALFVAAAGLFVFAIGAHTVWQRRQRMRR